MILVQAEMALKVLVFTCPFSADHNFPSAASYWTIRLVAALTAEIMR